MYSSEYTSGFPACGSHQAHLVGSSEQQCGQAPARSEKPASVMEA
jgi:hypothetical protein